MPRVIEGAGDRELDHERARVLIGGRWFDIEYDRLPDGDFLRRRVRMAVEGPTVDDPMVMPVWWGWTGSQQEGLLVLTQVAGVVEVTV